MAGNVATGLGTQAALVALPYQLYIETRSALLVGLLGAVARHDLAQPAGIGHDR